MISYKVSPWENLGNTIEKEDECGSTYRMKVPGGWLVRTAEYVPSDKQNYSYKIHQNITFVVDPEHTWKVELVLQDRYRAALEKIAKLQCDCGAPCDCYGWTSLVQIAKEAL